MLAERRDRLLELAEEGAQTQIAGSCWGWGLHCVEVAAAARPGELTIGLSEHPRGFADRGGFGLVGHESDPELAKFFLHLLTTARAVRWLERAKSSDEGP